MSRLKKWFVKFTGIKGRKQARTRAYHSEALAVKMRLVTQEQGRSRQKRGQ
jgi:hypothetical protein